MKAIIFENHLKYKNSQDQSSRSLILQDVEMFENPITKKRESPKPKDKAAAYIQKPKNWDDISSIIMRKKHDPENFSNHVLNRNHG